ncbi:MAG: Ig domain-containing protein [Candidatus Krumholzibacteria bacterium]|nr:Ig domain-containing protein [Candidatus Krumholzibacteria bacterium]
MRKVFAIFAGLVLLSMLAACSDDTTQPAPKPSTEFEITTDSLSLAYTCSPYSCDLAVQGGKAPYTWTLAAGSDPLPDGLVLTSEGKIIGLMSAAGDFNITVEVTDSSPTPKTLDKTYAMSVQVPSNPSLAVFYDGSATVCESATTAWVPLTCYVYIMLEGGDVACARAVEFKLCLTDADGVDLAPGEQFVVESVETPSYVAVTLGDPFGESSDGWAATFSKPKYGPTPILIATFDLLLVEDLSNLKFKFEAYENAALSIATCETGYPMVDVIGRESALNFEAAE